MTILGWLYSSASSPVTPNENYVLSKDIIALLLNQSADKMSGYIKRGDRTKMAIMLALRYPDMSKDVVNFLEHIREKVRFYKGRLPVINLQGEYEGFFQEMAEKYKYHIMQVVPYLTPGQSNMIDDLADLYHKSRMPFVVEFIHKHCREAIAKFPLLAELNLARSSCRAQL